MTEVHIYTDGACSPNPGTGGWGAILISPEHNNFRKEISGAEANTTNNRMELIAALKGLEMLKRPCRVNVYTDSAYLKNAFTQKWLDSWQRKGWKTADGKPVANKDLWEALLQQARIHEISWHWVKGHSDNPENNRCDELAVQARIALGKQA
ncbi:MAG: ribonuclease HI [SAR324 cluster bacterium]|nr:ribonuclease HI [SAR324 cluster bacterium]